MKHKPTLNQMRKDLARQLEKVGIPNAFDEAKWLIMAGLNVTNECYQQTVPCNLR